MDKGEAMKLIEELNDLSSNFEKNKERMIEIAKVLLTEHYKYLPRKNKQWDNVKDVEKSSPLNDQRNTV